MRIIIDRDPYLDRPENANGWTRGLWPAAWISHPETSAPPSVVAYRRRMMLDSAVALRIHVTADERYELFLDGTRIGRGSERGDPHNWFFESYDLALAAGPHVMVALVLAWLLRRVRALAGMRESPKFYAVRLLGRGRELLEQAGSGLVQARRLEQTDDIFFLQIAEARAAFAGQDQRSLVRERRAVYERELRRKQSPRLILSDGTTLDGDIPTGDGHHLRGTPASPGTYTGVARVVLDPSGARLEPGEILVAPSTDPGWTPLFFTAGGLVMEMGGMMSHGAVVAREYGIPAVVGVLGATANIQSGQRLTVDGARGVVLLVPGDDGSGGVA